MREISEATLAILKSQNLTGQNRFSHSLKMEGTELYTDIKQSYLKNFRTGGYYGDFCIRSDGKVLATYRLNNKIMLSIVDTEEQLLTIDNAVMENEWEFTAITYVSKNERSSILLRLKNGKILLFIYERGTQTTTNHFIDLYVSNNGLGNDFVFNKRISSLVTIGKEVSISDNGLGKAMQLASGRIILPAVIPIFIENYYFDQAGIFYTDDFTTWIFVKIRGQLNYSPSRFQGLAKFDNGKLAAMLPSEDASGALYIYESDDNGTNWIYKGDLAISIGAGYGIYSSLACGNDGYNYLLSQHTSGNAKLFRRKASDIPIDINYYKFENWEYLVELGMQDYGGFIIVFTPKGNIAVIGYTNDNYSVIYGYSRDEYSSALNVSSISISKGKGGSNTAAIQASNKYGALNPKNPDGPLYNVLETNKQIIIKQGYGDELVETFTGMIDDFDMSTWPQTTGIALRDNLKKALDQTITDENQHTVDFVSQPIENIVGYLCYLADIEVGVDAIEATGISVSMSFSWCSYADAFQQLGDLASFEWGCDSYGKFYFRRDYQPDNMFVAYTFEEGVDLATLKYKISDKDLYSKVVVFGKSGDTVISYEAPFLDAALYNILPQKILKIDATEASTVGALRKIAERSLSMMQSRTAVIQFTSIAIPWLEVGDFIGVYERSTGAASIYRLSDLSFSMDKDSFTMSGTAYYYGDSIVPGELPTDTATQTVAPTVNLIPEMTSNTAPSGVARASSVYTSAYEPWQAFNSHSDDLYWNAMANTGWVEYQFPAKTVVDKYMLKARQLVDYNKAMPKNWKFEAFDGEKWVVLNEQINQIAWQIHETREYKFANTTAYSKYRLNVSANNGFHRLQLEQLAMYYGGGA